MKTKALFKYSVNGTMISIPQNKITDDRADTGFEIVTKFDHQQHIIQYAEVVAVEKDEKIIEVGDTLIFHFNVTAYTYVRGVREISRHWMYSDEKNAYYMVPIDLYHAVIKKDGTIIMLNDYCFVEPHKIPAKEINGFIVHLEKEVDGRSSDTSAKLLHIDPNSKYKVGDIVALPTYGNYEIKLPDGSVVWAVKTNFLIGKYE